MYLNVNATAARSWLMMMGTAAARNDVTVQCCMSHCRVVTLPGGHTASVAILIAAC